MPRLFPTARRAVEDGILGETEMVLSEIYIHDRTGRVLFGDPNTVAHVLGYEERMGWKRTDATGVIRKARTEMMGGSTP